MNFEQRYENLNDAQKLAVDTIDGPVMVIAGPGTGKTELLSVRVANILKKTDTLPENILCLTFTESGATAMRERLTEIIGKEAYKVAIHTFHSFGSEVINRNGQFFYNEAHFSPADELNIYEIISRIFKELDDNNPLSKKNDGDYVYLTDSLKAISEIKRSGLVSEELIKILDENDAVIEKAEQLLTPIFNKGMSKATAEEAAKHITAIRNSNGGIDMPAIVPLSTVMADSLEEASSNAIEQNSTKPMTAWRNVWFKKDEKGDFVLRSRDKQAKLRALCPIYDKYLDYMYQACLYDYDDMILRVVHAMEVFDELRFNLQEQYQYIMVDEFQDTNLAQMRILHNLTNNEIVGDMPNILVVGDDDQAIYSFQGADISNIIDFRTNYPKAKLITLTENYRSTENILDSSRNIIIQGSDRLENRIKELNKKLSSQKGKLSGGVNLFEAESLPDERHWLVRDVKRRIESGEKASDIAVFTRRHSEINTLLPYFHEIGIAVNYERRDNVLEQPLIMLIEQIARLLIYIANGQLNEADVLLPKVLAHEAWDIEPIELWNLSLKAHNERKKWLETMPSIAVLKPVFDWLINTSLLIHDKPLENMLDIIIGKQKNDDENFTSPLYDYYFSEERLTNNPEEYLSYLEALRTIRSRLREYRANQNPTLVSFIEFIDLNRKINSTISSNRQVVHPENAINIMTAHKSKGLEFETVYIFNAVDNVWGEHARSRGRLINYPENLPLITAGDTEDERLRLFYVAMTRARKQLNISYSLTDDRGKSTIRSAFLVNSDLEPRQIENLGDISIAIEAAELAWYQPIIKPISCSMRDLLLPKLDNYKLSVTHLQNFLDVPSGGPQHFLVHNLLQFPETKSPNMSFGTAIHNTLQRAHNHLISTGNKQAIEDIVAIFEQNLIDQRLAKEDFDSLVRKGCDFIRTFMNEKYDSFNSSQMTELDFNHQNSLIGKAQITGKLDLVDMNKSSKTIIVTDYKTGKPSASWKGKDAYEKIKLHKYRQQLLFYKLLVENSRDYHGFSVEKGMIQFVQPDTFGNILAPLEIEFDEQELQNFARLVEAVWSQIINLELPDTSSYEQSIKGILAFEQDLIDN